MLYTILVIAAVLFLVSALMESVAVGGIGGLVLLVLLILFLMGRI